MIPVLALFAVALALAAWRARKGARVALALFCLLNVLAAARMAADGYPYAWALKPQTTPPGIDSP